MRWIYIACGILFIIIFGWIVIVKFNSTVQFSDFSGFHIEQKISGVYITDFTSREKKWELRAQEAQFQADSWSFHDVKLQVKNKKNQKYTLRGERARFKRGDEDLELEGNVTLDLNNRGYLRLDSIRYDVKSEQLISDAPLYISNEDSQGMKYEIWGQGLKVYLNDSKINLEQGVKWQVYFEKNRNSQLTAQRGYYWLHNHVAQLKGRVIAHYGRFKITGESADLIWKNGLIYAVQISGNVRMTDIHRWAKADRMLLMVQNRSLTLIGNSRLVQGNDDLSGHMIEFSEEDQKVRVHRAKVRVEQPEEKFSF